MKTEESAPEGKTRLSVPEFCHNENIKLEDVTGTYVYLLKMMHLFIKRKGFGGKVIINGRTLKQVAVDFYVDIARIRSFQQKKKTNVEKDDAYKAYWLLRRKALHVVSPFDDCEFVNEYFVASFLLTVIAYQKGIDEAKKKKNPTWLNFRKLLWRNLKYRHVSQPSLELMIEAFFCGCDFAARDTAA
jgi:hypothetical protein